MVFCFTISKILIRSVKKRRENYLWSSFFPLLSYKHWNVSSETRSTFQTESCKEDVDRKLSTSTTNTRGY